MRTDNRLGALVAVFLALALLVLPAAPALADAATLAPNGVGNFDQWSLGAGATKVAAVSSNDDDASYIKSSTVNQRQTFAFSGAGVPPGSTINSVTLNVVARRAQSAGANIRLVVARGSPAGDLSAGADTNPSYTSYTLYSRPLATNPFTAAAWTVAQVNNWQTDDGSAMYFGVSHNQNQVSHNQNQEKREARVTQISIVVDYTPPSDTTPPPAPTLLSPANGTVTNVNTVALDWSDVPDPSGPVEYQVQVYNDAGFSTPEYDSGWIAVSNATTGALADGTYSWRARARDAVPNEGPWSSVWTFTVDTTPPTGTVSVAYTWSPYVKGTVVISGTFSDPPPGSGVDAASSYLDIGGTQVYLNSITPTLGNFSYNWMTPDWSNGPVAVALYLFDNAGNSSSVDAFPTPIVDNASPTIGSVTTDKGVYEAAQAIPLTASAVADNVGGSGVAGVDERLTAPGVPTQGPNAMTQSDATTWVGNSLVAVVGSFEAGAQARDNVGNTSDWMSTLAEGRYPTSTVYTGDTSVASGNTASFSAKLSLMSLDAALVPEGQSPPDLSGEAISFSITDTAGAVVWGPLTATTDAAGVASLTNVVALLPGLYTIEADYGGNDAKLLGPSSSTAAFAVSDLANGGGWIIGQNATAKNPKATFGFSLYAVGGTSISGWVGSILYIDHGTGYRFKSSTVTGVASGGSLTMDFLGGSTTRVTVDDKGEPGLQDTLSFANTEYTWSGTLGDGKRGGGNIELR